MENHSKVVGRAMRRLRQQRQLSLRQAAQALSTSAPVLSRKERGEDEIERTDIRLAIASFNLTPWEAYDLWTAAGFIPEPTLKSTHTYDLRELAEALLPNLPFPAFILDLLGYLKAWNQGIEAIWTPSLAETKPVHILDDLFSPRLRQFLGERWDQYVLHAVQIFYHKTARVANDPTFRDLLDSLCKRHGEEFIRKWNEAQSDDGSQDTLPPIDVGGTIVPHDSPYGMIEYLVMQTIFRFLHEYELIMYVPLGTENQERYQRFKGTMGGNALYFSP